MSARFFITICFSFLLLQSSGQSAYSFRYSFRPSKDSNNYYAFLVRYDDGSGLLRIRFAGNGGGEDKVVETAFTEENPAGADGQPDTSLLLIKAVSPVYIQGEQTGTLTLPVFVFRYNPLTGFFDPAAVQPSGQPGTTAPLAWKFLEGANLDKATVGQFFTEDDGLYTLLFKAVTRSITPAEKKIRMHLLIVADTLDKTIGSAVAQDVNKVIALFDGISSYLGITRITHVIYGDTYNKTTVQNAIAKLKPAPADIVIFYYSGHGFRIPEKPAWKYPNMKLKNYKILRTSFRDSLSWLKADRQANITYSLNMEEVYNAIVKKGARFNLVMSDCCNDDIFAASVETTKPSKTKGSGVEWNEENIRSLFLNKTPLSLLVTAAVSGQRSRTKKGFGSIYTDYFKSSLEMYCSKLKTNVTWDQVLQNAGTQTTNKVKNSACDKEGQSENACIQVPDYRVRIGR